MSKLGVVEVFRFYPAKSKMRALISIPHAGEDIPEEMRSFLTKNMDFLSRDADFCVDQLIHFESLQERGVGILRANLHRVCIDLNRSPEEAVFYWTKNTRGEEVVCHSPSLSEKKEWALKYYDPYHKMLEALLEREIPLIDLHSMPSRAAAYHLKKNSGQPTERPPFCLSNLGFANPSSGRRTCTEDAMSRLRVLFKKHGFLSKLNDPYKGGYTTDSKAKFSKNVIQIETNRSLYMNEELRLLSSTKVKALKEKLTKILTEYFEGF